MVSGFQQTLYDVFWSKTYKASSRSSFGQKGQVQGQLEGQTVKVKSSCEIPWYQNSNKHSMMFVGWKLIKLAQSKFFVKKFKFKVNLKVNHQNERLIL